MAFAKADFQMTGIDSSKKASKKSGCVRKNLPKNKIIQKDIRKLDTPSKYNAIIWDYVIVH
ncbi:MAG: hypothetical protein B6U87_02605 [Candidatus Aenigmarchaeota archaeon ex4484_52]|nr:MAG: hypothetical protein B6U87_02605 [Candidatus Aenigmarchaeota archaeon ex4484_52]